MTELNKVIVDTPIPEYMRNLPQPVEFTGPDPDCQPERAKPNKPHDRRYGK